MNTALLFSSIEKLVTLEEDQKDFLSSILRERKIKKGQLLLQESMIQKASFFVTSGLLISYYTGLDGKDHVIHIAKEGWWMSDLNSFTRQREAILNIRAIESGSILELPCDQTTGMFERVPQMQVYFRVITERAFVEFQKRIIQNNSMSGKDRFAEFSLKFPDLLNRIPQKLIASYIGITPEFLSRIRKESYLESKPGLL
jgi:CRP-like cAMP-binding protein